VKTNYTGDVDSFKEVVRGCPVPVVIAGGPKMGSDREVLEMVAGAVEAGGAGTSIGRNIFQHKNPTKMVRAIAAIVH
ncbi:MAG: fructose-bisphosphate aldolase, partial [Euryarchaeota archaeon]|nr:fructose-bisphosphate aldolase [Euryarchaeota archaeon]